MTSAVQDRHVADDVEAVLYRVGRGLTRRGNQKSLPCDVYVGGDGVDQARLGTLGSLCRKGTQRKRI